MATVRFRLVRCRGKTCHKQHEGVPRYAHIDYMQWIILVASPSELLANERPDKTHIGTWSPCMPPSVDHRRALFYIRLDVSSDPPYTRACIESNLHARMDVLCTRSEGLLYVL